MKITPKTRRCVSVRLPESIAMQMEELARDSLRSLSSEVRRAIEAHLREHGRQPPRGCE